MFGTVYFDIVLWIMLMTGAITYMFVKTMMVNKIKED